MAGELLLQTIDMARYAAAEPAFDALEAGGALGAPERAIVRAALARAPAARGAPSGRAALRRILRSPGLAPRWFLSPGEIDAAVEALLDAACIEEGGVWRLDGAGGASWTVAEYALPMMMADPVCGAALFGPPEPRRLPHPRRGEAQRRLVARERLAPLAEAAAALAGRADGQAAREAAATARLAARARGRAATTLAHMSLL